MLATWVKTLYTTSASCIIICPAYYCCQNPSTSPKVVKWCYKHELIIKKAPCPCPFLKSQYLFLFPYYQPVEQVLVFRVFRASSVRHARVWCSSLAHVFHPSLSCMHACNHFSACSLRFANNKREARFQIQDEILTIFLKYCQDNTGRA